MATQIKGERVWALTREHDGHRTYKLKQLVVSDTWDGPARVLNTPGLPLPGSFWEVAMPGAAPIYVVGQAAFAAGAPSVGLNYTPGDELTITGGTVTSGGYPATILVLDTDGSGAAPGTGAITGAVLTSGGLYDVAPPASSAGVTGGTGSAAVFDLVIGILGGDIDLYAQCAWDANVEQVVKDEPGNWWEVEQTFSTKPDGRCQKIPVGDPRQLPPEISCNSIRYTEEATFDRFGNLILNSGHEAVRGPQVEFDANRSQIVVTQNSATLDLQLCESMKNTLNQYPLWKMPARTIKLSDFKWERKFWGECVIYFTRHFTFDTFLTVVPLPKSQGASSATVTTATDTSFRVGDMLWVIGGTLASGTSRPAQFIVTQISPVGGGDTGNVVSVEVVYPGEYATPPPDPVVAITSELFFQGGQGFIIGEEFSVTWVNQGGFRYVSGFDRNPLDEGTKVLAGDWDQQTRTRWIPAQLVHGMALDPNNPSHFQRFKDRNYENARIIYSSSMQGCPVRTGELLAQSDGLLVNNPGTGYVAGDILQVSGGTQVPGAPPAQIMVTQAQAVTGKIQQCYLYDGGNYVTPPANPVAVTNIPPAAGSGAQFYLTWADDTPNRLHIEKYGQSDFLQLGLPVDLESVYA
jgi:hypothetical protein